MGQEVGEKADRWGGSAAGDPKPDRRQAVWPLRSLLSAGSPYITPPTKARQAWRWHHQGM